MGRDKMARVETTLAVFRAGLTSRFATKIVVLVAAGTASMMSLWRLAHGAVRRVNPSPPVTHPNQTPQPLRNSAVADSWRNMSGAKQRLYCFTRLCRDYTGHDSLATFQGLPNFTQRDPHGLIFIPRWPTYTCVPHLMQPATSPTVVPCLPQHVVYFAVWRNASDNVTP
jgi:hypothetical protein